MSACFAPRFRTAFDRVLASDVELSSGAARVLRHVFWQPRTRQAIGTLVHLDAYGKRGGIRGEHPDHR